MVGLPLYQQIQFWKAGVNTLLKIAKTELWGLLGPFSIFNDFKGSWFNDFNDIYIILTRKLYESGLIGITVP